MKTISHAPLRAFVAAIFGRAGCETAEAGLIARRLVDANLAGHDSHGIVRVPSYLQGMGDGRIARNRHAAIVMESDAFAVVDGGGGFGQVIGGEAMDIGMTKAARSGIALVALRNVHHLGRIGDWPEACAARGFASIHFVNVIGYGAIVAPFGGRDARFSTNPFACGMPVAGGEPIILDMATSTIAEGKAMVARNKGVEVPPSSIIDAAGAESRDPHALYGPPPGALLAVGGHKGSGLAFFCDLLAGALSGGGCNHDGHANTRTALNNMLSIIIDPRALGAAEAGSAEVAQFVAWVKSARPQAEGGEVLVPGEPERRMRKERSAAGIPIDDVTYGNLIAAAEGMGIGREEIEAAPGVSG